MNGSLHAALIETDPASKCARVAQLGVDTEAAAGASGDPGVPLADDASVPGRPARPLLVHPAKLGRRSVASVEGRAILLHALAHIEFNAINLALDACWRFPAMPPSFLSDWLKVAREEATHFSMLRQHLNTLGFDYGDFPAHDGLWAMAERTKGDLLARLALVPRVAEARGLDVSPGIRARLAAAGDHAGAAILDVILRDEVGHVRIGNHWFHWLCARRGLDAAQAEAECRQRYRAPAQHGPFNIEARRAAGFTEPELERLKGCATAADGAACPRPGRPPPDSASH